MLYECFRFVYPFYPFSSIEEAFIKLLLEKSFEHVPYRGILDEVWINRMTFYKLLLEKPFEHATYRDILDEVRINRNALSALLDVRTERYMHRHLPRESRSTYSNRASTGWTVGSSCLAIPR